MNNWYGEHSGVVFGPVTLDELRFLKDRGRLTENDRLKQGTDGEWVPARTVVRFRSSSARTETAHSTSSAIVERADFDPDLDSSSDANGEDQHSQQEELRADAVAESPAPPTPPLRTTPGNAPDDDVRKKILIGSGVGAGIVLLVFLLLLLLMRLADRMPDDGGRGAVADSGRGANRGSQSGEAASQQANSPGSFTPASSERGSEESGGNEPTAGEQAPPEQPDVETGLRIARLEGADSSAAKGGGQDDLGLGGGGGSGSDIEFFGVKGKGNRFVYVVDCSGSMTFDRFSKATAELKRSIGRLKSRQSFYVFFFDHAAYPMFSPAPAETKLLKASSGNVDKLNKWVDAFRGGGGTDPRDALLRALQLKPDMIFLLSDGAFDPIAIGVARTNNPRKKVSINTIGFVDRSGEPLLKQIAKENRGDYRFVP